MQLCLANLSRVSLRVQFSQDNLSLAKPFLIQLHLQLWTSTLSPPSSRSCQWTMWFSMKAKRERDIGIQDALYSNPMSKRTIEHNMRLADIVADLVDAVSFGGAIINATVHNLPQVNRAISLMLSGIQCLRDRIAADEEKHLIAKHSDLGWKLVSNMEGLEGQVGRISMINLRAQESAFLKHQQAMDSVSKSGSGASGGTASRY